MATSTTTTKKIVVTTKDLKTGFGDQLVTYLNQQEARRDFERAAKTPGNKIHDFTIDMEMWQIGTYDIIKGQIEELEEPELLIAGVEIVNA